MRALLAYSFQGQYEERECVHDCVYIIPEHATPEQIEAFGKEHGVRLEEIPVTQVLTVTREVLEIKKTK